MNINELIELVKQERFVTIPVKTNEEYNKVLSVISTINSKYELYSGGEVLSTSNLMLKWERFRKIILDNDRNMAISFNFPRYRTYKYTVGYGGIDFYKQQCPLIVYPNDIYCDNLDFLINQIKIELI